MLQIDASTVDAVNGKNCGWALACACRLQTNMPSLRFIMAHADRAQA